MSEFTIDPRTILGFSEEIKADVEKAEEWAHYSRTGEIMRESIALIEALQAELEAVKRERDAAVEELQDYASSGVNNQAPYCGNSNSDCIDSYGWCIGEKCKGERGPLAVMSVPPRPSNFDMQFSAAFDELKAYRDTGLAPEEIYEQRFLIATSKDPQKMRRLADIIKADEDGRCVVLPVAIGQKLWLNLAPPRMWAKNRPFEVSVVFIGLNGVKPFMNVGYKNEWTFPFDLSEIGKTVFLTREAAEAALKERENNG